MIAKALRLFSFSLLFTVVLARPALAQSPGAATAANAAYELFSAGNHKEAAAAYEKLLKDFPTDGVIPAAQLQLAFCYYLLGQFQPAQDILTKLSSGPPIAPELKQIADGLLPQIISSKASAMPEKDPKRKTTYEEALAKFSDYITKYPQAQDLESAIYSRAITNYQLAKYDEAIKDLELNIQKFPQSGTIASSKNLLAATLATQGSLELTKGNTANRDAAFALYKRATDLLREIISKKEDIALINEANFQLGEILFNQAAFSDDAQKPALYNEALSAYRAIAPKEEIIALQQQMLREFPARRLKAIQARNEPLRKQLDRDNERELKKLAELQGRPDQIGTAVTKMGEIFFQQEQYNKARVVLQHVTPFLATDDDKKRAEYFTTMSYALQNVPERATTGYEAFMSKHKGDSIADNMPVAMGNMYLGLNKVDDAIRYYNESLSLYPNGRFVGLSVVYKATAEARLKKYDEALKTFKDFLSKNPPPEIGVVAQSGLAGIYKDTMKWDDAIAAYKVVREKYPNTPQAVEADYWVAICTQQKGDNAAAVGLLDAFVKANEKHPQAALALYSKATAQITLGKKDEGIADLAAVADKYPDSQPAPFTFFMRAQIYGKDGKNDEVVKLMRQFIEKYPKDEKVFYAYDSIAGLSLSTGQIDEALAAYREFAQKYPENPKAPDAIIKVADLQRTSADKIGINYSALSPEEQSRWKDNVQGAVTSIEEMIKTYPDSPALALALQSLLTSQRMLLKAGLKTPAEVEQYFQSLADTTTSASAKSKILFALANFLAEKDKARALAMMNEAFNAEIIYAPADLDFYGLALINEGKLDEANAIFDKLASNYPIPAGSAPAQAQPSVQEAQASALFGKGRIAQEKKQTAEAGVLFERLKAEYPWSPKVLEANFGIAESLKQKGELDKALDLLGSIVRASNAPPALGAKSMMLGGDIMTEKMKAATDPKQKQDFRGAAIDYYFKIVQLYGGIPTIPERGLMQGAELLEQQVNETTGTDPKAVAFKAQQLTKAKNAYQQLIKEYPNSDFVPKAKERLAALGGPGK